MVVLTFLKPVHYVFSQRKLTHTRTHPHTHTPTHAHTHTEMALVIADNPRLGLQLQLWKDERFRIVYRCGKVLAIPTWPGLHDRMFGLARRVVQKNVNPTDALFLHHVVDEAPKYAGYGWIWSWSDWEPMLSEDEYVLAQCSDASVIMRIFTGSDGRIDDVRYFLKTEEDERELFPTAEQVAVITSLRDDDVSVTSGVLDALRAA